LFSDKYKTHKYSVGRTYSCWMLNCWCITWPVGYKRLTYLTLRMTGESSVVVWFWSLKPFGTYVMLDSKYLPTFRRGVALPSSWYNSPRRLDWLTIQLSTRLEVAEDLSRHQNSCESLESSKILAMIIADRKFKECVKIIDFCFKIYD